MDVYKLLLIAVLFILTLIKQSGAIECYDCWTKDDDTCGYPETLGEPGGCGVRDNVCKKIVTKYYSVIKKGRDSYYELVSNVTSRLCGKSHWTGCNTMYGSASETTECACDEDGCNAAPGAIFLSAALLSITAATSIHLLTTS